ncbi:hypothetical protein [Chryseobacterium sp. SIMBA_029]|uniref:hypothetical protein n=1 Tax=Chryseobacterium sp. SIMBA_029 TaxID=3085772 RepID=UPI00397A82CB
MNNRSLLFFLTLIFSFLNVQNIDAQEKNKLLDRNILTEVKTIQKRFSDSLNRYDYKKDSAVYLGKYRIFYGEKIKNLKNLYQKIYDKEVMIGKVDPNISFKITNGLQIENHAPKALAISQEDAKDKSIDIAEVENYQQLEELRKQLTKNFPVYLLEEYEGGVYRCMLNFTIDVDGKFKNVKYSGSPNTEFSIISALFLYAIGTLEKPLFYNKIPIAQNFSQPIVLRFE